MLKTSWPGRSDSKVTNAHERTRRKRPLSKAKRAERRLALDKSQLEGREEYARKVFMWTKHEETVAALETRTETESSPLQSVQRVGVGAPVTASANCDGFACTAQQRGKLVGDYRPMQVPDESNVHILAGDRLSRIARGLPRGAKTNYSK